MNLKGWKTIPDKIKGKNFSPLRRPKPFPRELAQTGQPCWDTAQCHTHRHTASEGQRPLPPSFIDMHHHSSQGQLFFRVHQVWPDKASGQVFTAIKTCNCADLNSGHQRIWAWSLCYWCLTQGSLKENKTVLKKKAGNRKIMKAKTKIGQKANV